MSPAKAPSGPDSSFRPHFPGLRAVRSENKSVPIFPNQAPSEIEPAVGADASDTARSGVARRWGSLPYYVFRNTLKPMILSFKCRETQALFEGKSVRRFKAFGRIAERKLAQLHAAQTLAFLRSPPGNSFEMLKGARKGQHSIRVNDQWRVCFIWTASGPSEVEIVDYH